VDLFTSSPHYGIILRGNDKQTFILYVETNLDIQIFGYFI